MKRITITLADDDLRSAIESEAEIAGSTEQDVIIQALRFWIAEDREKQRAIAAARREYRKAGGGESRGFFDKLWTKGRAMLYAAWLVASVFFLPLGFLGVVVPAVTGWMLPAQLMNLSALMLVSSVPGIAYLIATSD